MSQNNQSLRTIFNEAVEIADARQRSEYLAQACGDDTILRQRIEELIAANNEAGRFLGSLGDTDRSAGPNDASGGTALLAAIAEQVGDRIDRYKLLQNIGEGGCGVVYMAEQEQPLRRRVALKVIKLGMDTKSVIARFEAERQALALMDHPNIAKVLDAGATDAGRPYFVMELVKGVRITDYCDQNNLTTTERLALFSLVCHAIQHAHQKGIIHRDIKPSNILVTLHDGVPVPKVIDFGIAKATSDQRLTDKTLFTAFEQFMGTPAYMSPEQAEMSGLDIDTRSDIYALGVLLYELLTGKPPFDGKELLASGLDAMRRTIREREPAKPSTRLSTMLAADLATVAKQRQTEAAKLTSSIRGDLDWIVMKALEKDRTRRYDTANGLALDIQRHLNNEPVLAGPPTAAYRLRKFVRKHRAAVSVAAAFLLLLTSATGVSIWLAVSANRERANARRAEGSAKQARGEAEQEAVRANRERANALQAEHAAKQSLTEIQLQRVEDFFAANDSARAIAFLAHVLTSDPSNRVAAERLVSALTFRNFGLPVSEGLQHARPVTSALSPDGLRVVAISNYRSNYTVRVWDAQTGKPLTEPLRHENVIQSAQFSPDGLRVVTASGVNTVRVWDTQTGQPLGEPLRTKGGIQSAQFSPDGLRVITTSRDKTARVWDAQTGKPLTQPLRHEDAIQSAQFSPDGLRVVTASSDKTARVWDAQTGKPLTQPLRHESWVKSAQFSPDGMRVVTSSGHDTALIWDTQTGKRLTILGDAQHSADPIKGFVIPSASAQFSPDGMRVITTSAWGKTARVWDAQTGTPLFESLQHENFVTSARFSPDGLRVLTASSQGRTARVWDAQTGKPLTEPLRHLGWVDSAQFSSDGQRVVAAGVNFARVWDVQTGESLSEPLPQEHTTLSAHSRSSDGLRVLAASINTVQVLDAQTGKPLTQPLRHEGSIESAQFSPVGLRVVTASSDKTARVWDAQTGKPLTEPLRHGQLVASAQFSPDGLRVVTASWDNTARVWDAQTGKPLTEPLRHKSWVNSAQFSPDGLRVLTASVDETARMWDAQTGKPLAEPLRHEDGVNFAQFSPDGQRVVTASGDMTARVWDTQTGRPLTGPLRHEARVRSAQFSPDGQRVVTASEDKTARVWDAQTGQPLSEPLRHEQTIGFAHFSPDGLRVVTFPYPRGTSRAWEMTFCPVPAPPWLPELAVIVAGKRLTETSVLKPVSAEEFLKLKEQLSADPATDFYTRWGKWFCADRATRTISPFSKITVPEFVQQRLAEGTAESLREAVNLSPTNGLAFARLARKLLPEDPVLNPREAAEAQWFSQRALELAPNDAEVLRIHVEVTQQARRRAPQ